ncbi:MAG TPA: aminodeoxychorismate synthase component I [Nocardioidaceae bacterium]|nr:aminodeoxychorismate synthase component I [Nocardioidaceae bacterium]
MSWVDPERVFAAVAARHDRMFWLDGGGARAWSGRFSYLGWLEPGDLSLTYDAATGRVREHDGHRSRVVGDDIFAALEARPAAWVGWFGYAARPDLPALTGDGAVPDACWMRVSRYLLFDHAHGTVRRHGIDTLPQSDVPDAADAEARVLSTWGEAEYGAAFAQVQEQLHAGNSYEINLTYRTEIACDADPVAVYLRLRRLNPAPYAGYFAHRGVSVLSSSPERFASIDAGGLVETRPIKGTTPRSDDPEEDARLAESLRTDPKFRAENLMIVDLLRNDLATVCEPGSVVVPELMHVETYPSVHQLVTTVRGRLRPGTGALRAVHALFPGGSMTGAPKLRSMQIIADVEDTPRGVYSGAAGRIGADGTADLGIVIRTLVHGDGVYRLGTGGGITVVSDAAAEFAETGWKVDRLLRALG